MNFKISRHSLNFYGKCLDEKSCLKIIIWQADALLVYSGVMKEKEKNC